MRDNDKIISIAADHIAATRKTAIGLLEAEAPLHIVVNLLQMATSLEEVPLQLTNTECRLGIIDAQVGLGVNRLETIPCNGLSRG